MLLQYNSQQTLRLNHVEQRGHRPEQRDPGRALLYMGYIVKGMVFYVFLVINRVSILAIML